MITFILNNEMVCTANPAGSSLLDFIRFDMELKGTKSGCREGDCGACTVLMGTPENGGVTYRSIVSCLTPLANVHGKHIVTIEGINTGFLTPVQKALVDNSATQCGFCTPGIVMSLSAAELSMTQTTFESLIASLSGNICRCTGYKSIERAAEEIALVIKEKDADDPVGWLVANGHLPGYFLSIAGRLEEIEKNEDEDKSFGLKTAGGTDLMVQKADEMSESVILPLQALRELNGITIMEGRCIIGASVTMSEISHSPEIRKYLPELNGFMKLIGSEQVRNMATVAGNIANASPIGDMTVMLLALGAELTIKGEERERIVPLKEFFIAYKKTDLADNEHIRNISFDIMPESALFNFEKVSRRTHLDIASVNSAMLVRMDGQRIGECHIAAGGVSPVPLCLDRTCEFLRGKEVTSETILQTVAIMKEEISPISDVRGSAEYKTLLLRQLIIAHFLKLFPGRLNLSPEMI
ncbi:MAG: FAD binding domain-containing protein [Bacteroidales bacterium]|jgi:xanthine dehydrogenase small subunit|nr:FAD binding domain-containing protein [Bacteroidales bacterium]